MNPENGSRTIFSAGKILDDRFQIEEWLGSGAFGDVYRARQLVFGYPLRQVAIKLFKQEAVSAENLHDAFGDAISLISLQEENPSPQVARRMVQIYDIGLLKAPRPQAFMSMRLVPGKLTLDTAVRRHAAGGMPVAATLGFLRQMLTPLAWMHGLEVPGVHGDLKPNNVLMTDDGTLILADFGLASRMPIGALGGTVAYQAPETLACLTATPHSDMYAIGLIWYEMLTGRHAFEEVGMEAMGNNDTSGYVRAHLDSRKWPIRSAAHVSHDRIVPASEINPEMGEHPQLEAMLARCLTYRVEDRYPNARRLLEDIRKYIDGRHVDVRGMANLEPDSDLPPVALKSGKTPAGLVQDAQALLAARQPEKAVALLDQVLARDAQFLPALLLRAMTLADLGRFEEAWQSCERAQAIAPKKAADRGVLEAKIHFFGVKGNKGMVKTLTAQLQSHR